MLSIIHPTMSWLEPILLSRTASFILTPLPSHSGMLTITESTSTPRKPRMLKSKTESQKKLKTELKNAKKLEPLNPSLLNNLPPKDFLLALVQDLDNPAELMVTFFKEKNLSFTQRKSNQERNDLFVQLNIYSLSFSLSIIFIINQVQNIIIFLQLQKVKMKNVKANSQEKIEKIVQSSREELILQIMKAKDSLSRLDKKVEEQNHKCQKMMESNMRNQKRLLRYRARIEQMGRYKDSPQHFLTMSGYMNECVQQYIFSHNYAFNVNPNQLPDPDRMSYQQLLELGDQIGKVSKGLTKQQIEKLSHKKMNKNGGQCPVCQNQIQIGQDVIELKCRHTYHEECILFWLKDENTCPICKQYLAESSTETEKKFGL